MDEKENEQRERRVERGTGYEIIEQATCPFCQEPDCVGRYSVVRKERKTDDQPPPKRRRRK
jgi:hypothetical protein